MAPKAVDIEPLKEEITRWILDQGLAIDDVSSVLQRRGITLSSRSLRRRLQAWGVSPKPHADYNSETLRARISQLFYDWRLGDSEMLEILQYDGHKISRDGLKRLRQRMGLYRTLPTGEAEVLDHQRIREILRQEFDDGTIESYGRMNLHAYICARYHITGR